MVRKALFLTESSRNLYHFRFSWMAFTLKLPLHVWYKKIFLTFVQLIHTHPNISAVIKPYNINISGEQLLKMVFTIVNVIFISVSYAQTRSFIARIKFHGQNGHYKILKNNTTPRRENLLIAIYFFVAKSNKCILTGLSMLDWSSNHGLFLSLWFILKIRQYHWTCKFRCFQESW